MDNCWRKNRLIRCEFLVKGLNSAIRLYPDDGLTTSRHIPCIVVQGRYDIVCPVRLRYPAIEPEEF